MSGPASQQTMRDDRVLKEINISTHNASAATISLSVLAPSVCLSVRPARRAEWMKEVEPPTRNSFHPPLCMQKFMMMNNETCVRQCGRMQYVLFMFYTAKYSLAAVQPKSKNFTTGSSIRQHCIRRLR